MGGAMKHTNAILSRECGRPGVARARVSRRWPTALLVAGAVGLLSTRCPTAVAAKLTLVIPNSQSVKMVGAFQRWDQDGNPRKKVNPKAKIDVPEVDYVARRADAGQWVFEGLAPGKYDLVILAGERVRIEGFDYAPVLEFDPFFPPDATVDDETRDWVFNDIKKSKHYENKVVPLYIGGDQAKKTCRVLVMLIRDKPTSYESDFPGAATIRHEIWQYTWNYGGWQKERRTRVLDRSILHRDELRKWTWLWDPRLGGIRVEAAPVTKQYTLPTADSTPKLQGLYPY